MNFTKNSKLSKVIYSLTTITGLTLFISMFGFDNKYHQVLVDQDWGGGRFEALNDIQENHLGNLVVVGQSKSRSEGKEDFYIAITDPFGELIMEKKIGRRKKDIANAVTLTNDGGYLIAGYTESEGENYKGGQDAVLVKLDEALNDVWFESALYSTEGDERFNDVEQFGKDNFVVTGIQNDQFYTCALDGNGKKLWSQTLTDYEYSEGLSIVVASSGNIIITGAMSSNPTDKKNKTEYASAVVMALSPTGQVLWQKTYDAMNDKYAKERLISGNSITELSNGNFGIGGTAFGHQYKEGMALLVITPNGEQLFCRPYGQEEQDISFGIAQDYSNDLYLAGLGALNGEQRSQGWIQKISPIDGEKVWTGKNSKNMIGSGRNDEFRAITHTSDGSMIMVGMKKSKFKSGQAWFYKTKPEIPNNNIPSKNDMGFQKIELNDNDKNNLLTSGEGGYLKVPIQNNSSQDFYNLNLHIDLGANDANLNIPENIAIGWIAGNTTKNIIIPLYKSDILLNPNTAIRIALRQNDTNIGAPLVYKLNTAPKAEAMLAFEKVDFEEMGKDGLQRGASIRLVGNLMNKGNIEANDITLAYEVPYNIQGLSEPVQKLGSLLPGQSRRINIEFKPDFAYFEDVVNIYIKAIDGTATAAVEEQHQMTIEEKKVEPRSISSDLDVQFVGDLDTRSIVVNKPAFTVPMEILSNHEIVYESFKLAINGTESFPLDRTIIPFVHNQESKDLFQFQYQNKERIVLAKGLNEIKWEVTTAAGTIQTKVVKVTYNPHEPELHLVSIGVPIDQIKEYATNDASLFAETFKEAGKNYFKTIHATVKNNNKDTFERSLARTFYDLKKAYFSGKIKSDDLLIVFISAHATTATPGTFKIKASNFDGFYPDLTSIDYIDNIERFLGQINCQKMILLDVFNELDDNKDNEGDKESSKDNPELSNEFLAILAKNPNSTPVLMSCGPDAASQECALKGNGLFAHSIFEALRTDQTLVVDADHNNVITVQEFYNYLRSNTATIAANACNLGKQELAAHSPNISKNDDYTLLLASAY